MGLPLYDCSVRTSVVASGGALASLLPPALAQGTGRALRLRQLAISNTTATAFGVAIGVATAAGATPGGAGTVVRRSNNGGTPIDPASVASVFTTYGTAPTAPAGFHARLWVPGNSLVVWGYDDGDELIIPPAATPLPFAIWLTSTGQLADVTLSWEE